MDSEFNIDEVWNSVNKEEDTFSPSDPDLMDWGLCIEDYKEILAMKKDANLPDELWIQIIFGQVLKYYDEDSSVEWIEAVSRSVKLNEVWNASLRSEVLELDDQLTPDEISQLESIARGIAIKYGREEVTAEKIIQKYYETRSSEIESEDVERKIQKRTEEIRDDLPGYLDFERIFVAPPETNVFINDSYCESSQLINGLDGAPRELVVWDADFLTDLLSQKIVDTRMDNLCLISVGGAGDITTQQLYDRLSGKGLSCRIVEVEDVESIGPDENIVVVDDVLKTGQTVIGFIRNSLDGRYVSLIATWLTAYYPYEKTAWWLDSYAGRVVTGIVYDGLNVSPGALPVNSMSTLLADDRKAGEVVSSLDDKYFRGKLAGFVRINE